jgi:UDP-N-acetylglucosamine--dolichyl-phosphate N-acetylglucosaminephosphotransferase
MLDTISLAGVALIFIVTFLVTFISTPIIGKLMKQHGVTGRDVHKLSKTEIPEMCGLAILLGLTVGALCYALFFPNALPEIIAFIGTIVIAGGIGFIDDIHPLSARIKPLLTALACPPILLLGVYDPHPIIPFLGPVRLTVVYPFLIPIALAVTSNAVNMMDVMNGSMSGTAAIISITIAGILIASGDGKGAAVAGGLLAALLAFYYFNRFPARVFSGDTGSLAVGAALGALSILGRLETVMIVALIPHIMNAFYGLSSVGRLYERREIANRPTRLLDDERLEASADRSAPVTLARIILASKPLKEREVVRGMMFLTIISSILAVLTYDIMLVGRI